MHAKKLRWLVGGIFGLGLILFSLIGFAHTRSGAFLLPAVQLLVGKPKSCPLGYDQPVSLVQRKKSAVDYLEAHQNLRAVSQKLVPGFRFGLTKRQDLESFAAARSGSCHAMVKSPDIECLNVKTAHGQETLWAMFDERDRLINLRAVETFDSVTAASNTYAALVKNVEKQVGPPTSQLNSFSPDHLKSGLLYQASREYFYKNYFSTLRVTNMGQTFAITTEFNDPELYR